MDIPRYGFGKTLPGTLDEVRPRVEAALKEQGFGILTEIDVKATFKKKLDVDFRPYVILGACNPVLANKAIGGESWIGLLLPCNVVLQASATAGHTDVGIIDPHAMFTVLDDPTIGEVADEAARRLRAALDLLA